MSSTTVTKRTDRVRLCTYISPKEGMSVEEFQDYWLNHHGKLFSSLAVVKRNVLKYEQVSTPPLPPFLLPSRKVC